MRERIAFVVELSTKQDWHSIRRLLKSLLRGYKLRCVEIRPEPAKEDDQ